MIILLCEFDKYWNNYHFYQPGFASLDRIVQV